MRVGIIGLLQESNTFIQTNTSLRHFEDDLLLTGQAIRERMRNASHEVGGFISELESAGCEAVPIFLARAYPAGVIQAAAFDELERRMIDAVEAAGPLDGLLAAAHGATVAENHRDADGHWLSRIRRHVNPQTPLIATIDPHANVSQAMVDATDAMFAYRTNPHLDQLDTGRRAAKLMTETLRGNVCPVQRASFPPLAINIRSQTTAKPPLSNLFAEAEKVCRHPRVLSHSIVLGFPYADVEEMGSSVIVVTDGDAATGSRLADDLADRMWNMRDEFEPEWVSVDSAIAQVETSSQRTLLLDMGDNVGGGSPGDGTFICSALQRSGIGPSFVCLCDPESVRIAVSAGIGQTVSLALGGKTDDRHGAPLQVDCSVVSIHDGRFRETQSRHGGFQDFDQGKSVILRTDGGLTVLVTSLRVPPFSLEQLRVCGLDPIGFRVLIAKGVIAPLAAYGPVCDRVIHVNTPGVTCADMKQLQYTHRRRPMYPFEQV